MKLPAELLARHGLTAEVPTVEPAPAPPKPVGCVVCLESSVRPGWCYCCDGEGCAECDDTGACPDCGVTR